MTQSNTMSINGAYRRDPIPSFSPRIFLIFGEVHFLPLFSRKFFSTFASVRKFSSRCRNQLWTLRPQQDPPTQRPPLGLFPHPHMSHLPPRNRSRQAASPWARPQNLMSLGDTLPPQLNDKEAIHSL